MLKKVLLTLVLVLAMSVSAFAGDLLKMVPEDAAFIFSINLQKIMTTETVKKAIDDGMAKQTPEQKKAYDEFIQKTGIDPMKHISELLVIMPAKSGQKTGKPEAAVVVNGTFDKAKILETLKTDKDASKEMTIEKFEGFDSFKSKKEDDATGVFVDNNTVLLGNTPVVKSVIDVKNGKGKDISNNASFKALLAKVDSTASIWGAGVIPQTMKDQAKANPQAAPLANVNTISFSFNYDKEITFNFMGEVDKKENMDQVMTSLNGFLAMVKMIGGQNPQAAEVLSMIKVEGEGTTAKISMKVSAEKIEEIKKKIQEQMKQGAAGAPGAAPAPAVETK